MLPQLERTTVTAWSQWRLGRETAVQEVTQREVMQRSQFASANRKPTPDYEIMWAHNRQAMANDRAEQAKVNQFFVGEFPSANDERMDAYWEPPAAPEPKPVRNTSPFRVVTSESDSL